MFSTLKEIIIANFKNLATLWSLGLRALERQRRDTIFGWFWLFAQPLIYVLAFGVALEVGIRQERNFESTRPYLLWLAGGVYPWFFIKWIFGDGRNIFKSQSRLIKTNVLPMAAIPTVGLMPQLIVFLLTYVAMLLIAWPFGAPPTIYWLQLPLIAALMIFFVYCFSLMVSCWSALSKDFANVIKVLNTPIFWLSGIIFNISGTTNKVLKAFLDINPVTFLVNAFRDSVYFDKWAFTSLHTLLPFLAVLLLTALMAWRNYHLLKSEVLDAL